MPSVHVTAEGGHHTPSLTLEPLHAGGDAAPARRGRAALGRLRSPYLMRRSLAGTGLHLAVQPIRALSGAAGRAESVLDSAAHLVETVEHFVDHTREGSFGSVLAYRSAYSVLSWVSAGSILSVGSVGSFGSLGSAGSIFSIGSAGSVLSIGSVGSVCAIGGVGQLGPKRRDDGGDPAGDRSRRPGPDDPGGRPLASVVRSGATVLGVLALGAAVAGARSPSST